jgi:hypothetical protein
MTIRKHKRTPIIGPAFAGDFRDEAGRVQGYVDELRYYRPRGFSKLAIEGERMIARDARGVVDAFDHADFWKDGVEALLTEWGRRVARNDYLSFGAFYESGDGSVGFMVNTDAAIEDADHVVDDSYRGRNDGELPKGFSGLYVHISDHGNVAAYTYSNGRKCRELFAVV